MHSNNDEETKTDYSAQRNRRPRGKRNFKPSFDAKSQPQPEIELQAAASVNAPQRRSKPKKNHFSDAVTKPSHIPAETEFFFQTHKIDEGMKAKDDTFGFFTLDSRRITSIAIESFANARTQQLLHNSSVEAVGAVRNISKVYICAQLFCVIQQILKTDIAQHFIRHPVLQRITSASFQITPFQAHFAHCFGEFDTDYGRARISDVTVIVKELLQQIGHIHAAQGNLAAGNFEDALAYTVIDEAILEHYESLGLQANVGQMPVPLDRNTSHDLLSRADPMSVLFCAYLENPNLQTLNAYQQQAGIPVSQPLPNFVNFVDIIDEISDASLTQASHLEVSNMQSKPFTPRPYGCGLQICKVRFPFIEVPCPMSSFDLQHAVLLNVCKRFERTLRVEKHHHMAGANVVIKDILAKTVAIQM